MRIFGVFLMIVGFVGVAIGISFMSGADSTEEIPAAEIQQEAELKTGVYYLNGDESGAYIEIFDDETFVLSGNERQAYKLKVWKNMTETDEETGRITVKDLYFLGTNLNGGTSFSDNIRVRFENNSLEYDNNIYFLNN